MFCHQYLLNYTSILKAHNVNYFCCPQLADAAKLKPLEAELKMLEDLSQSIVDDFSDMRVREEQLRDTNGMVSTLNLVYS